MSNNRPQPHKHLGFLPKCHTKAEASVAVPPQIAAAPGSAGTYVQLSGHDSSSPALKLSHGSGVSTSESTANSKG